MGFFGDLSFSFGAMIMFREAHFRSGLKISFSG